jgi:hypothetical protein
LMACSSEVAMTLNGPSSTNAPSSQPIRNSPAPRSASGD